MALAAAVVRKRRRRSWDSGWMCLPRKAGEIEGRCGWSVAEQLQLDSPQKQKHP